MRFSLVNLVNQQSLKQLIDILRTEGIAVFVIDGRYIYDAPSFFTLVREVLPLDPMLSGKVNWDALADSLWTGLDNFEAKEVAIVWTSVDNMLLNNLSNLLSAVICFNDVGRNLSTTKYGATTPIRLFVFLVGEGKNFTNLEDLMI